MMATEINLNNSEEFQEMIDREMNRMLELSNFKEANEVINRIMRMDNGLAR